MPVLKFDQYLNSHGSFFQLGFGGSVGTYAGSGSPFTWKKDTDLKDLEKYQGSVNIVLLPITIYSNLRIFPFGSNFILSGALGYRETYIEEVIDTGNSIDSKYPMTKGWNSLAVVRFALEVRLDGLTGESIESSRRLINLSGVFLSPYYEKSISIKDDSLWGGRKIFPSKFASSNFGISFSFQFG